MCSFRCKNALFINGEITLNLQNPASKPLPGSLLGPLLPRHSRLILPLISEAFMCVLSRSAASESLQWTATRQAPLSMGFSRQEYWSGLPCPSPGNLPNPGIELRSPTLPVDSLPSEPPGKPKNLHICLQIQAIKHLNV